MVDDEATVFVMEALAGYKGLDNFWEELQSTRLKVCLQFETYNLRKEGFVRWEEGTLLRSLQEQWSLRTVLILLDC